jgi:two-component system CheB/CheR fusion protein
VLGNSLFWKAFSGTPAVAMALHSISRMMTTRVSERDRSLIGVHAMLVDDEPSSLDEIKRALEYSGAIVTARVSVRRALATMHHVKPNVLVVGIQIPDENAYWLVRSVRASSRAAAVPAIAITPLGYESERIATEGFQAQLPRPVHVSALCETVIRVVTRPFSDPGSTH